VNCNSDINYTVSLRNCDHAKMFGKSRKTLTLEERVKALEMYDKKSSRRVGEAFGESKDQIQRLIKCNAFTLNTGMDRVMDLQYMVGKLLFM
jgi:uncharacterized protein YigE (DUF2233 family)